MSVKKSNTSPGKVSSTIARSGDGTIQITFSIPYTLIDKNKKLAADELAQDIEVPGFRKGRAPIEKVIEKIPENTLLEKTLGKLLPKLIAEAINEHKIKPAIYPKFELVKAKEKEDWQIRAITCEIPEVNLGDYKKKIAGIGRAKSIWTPRQTQDKLSAEDKPQKLTREEKVQGVIKALLEAIELKVPRLLIEEEANSRLSQLLSRLEKLGLNLETYLSSIKKTTASLRAEYEEAAEKGIALDIILNKIASKENITTDETQIDAAIKASASDPELVKKLNTPEQRSVIGGVLRRRAALDLLVSLL